MGYLHIGLKKHSLLLPAACGASHHFRHLYDTNVFFGCFQGISTGLNLVFSVTTSIKIVIYICTYIYIISPWRGILKNNHIYIKITEGVLKLLTEENVFMHPYYDLHLSDLYCRRQYNPRDSNIHSDTAMHVSIHRQKKFMLIWVKRFI